ncbi:RecX family transcriptional regulator [Flammeovirga pectinis]|uniref:Regulatory protein RecX n=1 Tax=Flammeovirga pectinis TaxID=2494373 RepID=A0A3Q9FMY7_9BACT|nr:regulatory protein RecX [Flammeovirga pectinis]AZQ61355.1 RecX family transcriptional regulator [Flammeovirga pectinis]
MEYTFKQVLPKIAAYCSYQDRCRQEIQNRLQKWEYSYEDWPEVFAWLKDNKFWDEERYAASFVRGKFRGNKWGKRKIMMALYQKGVPQEIGNKALSEIKEEEYQEVALKLASKKIEHLREKGEEAHIVKGKTLQYLAGKGFESQTCYNAVDDAIYRLDNDVEEEF